MKWKTIKGFENYEISNTGLIRKGEQILSPFNNSGYLRIQLINGDKKEKILMHRLVANAFIPNDNEDLQINHKDLDKKNNNVDNLEWVTGSENVNHAIENIPNRLEELQSAMSKIGKKHGVANAMKSRKPVEQLTLDGEVIKWYASARDASRELNISYKVISKCCNGHSKTYKGFKWRFADK